MNQLPPSAGDQNTAQHTNIEDALTLLTTGSASLAIGDPTLSSAALAALGQRYDILADAGHGSMGNVYKARDRETGETVALKLLKPEIASDQDMMERFKNELLYARRITHKNVCRVYEFNRVGGIAYTSMEFVEGESLRSVLRRFGGLPQRKGIDLSLQICSGLREAHAQGIVHRDLKPENVMIDTRGNVKIMDFGIARSMEAMTRLTGAMVGTPAYMAPEQVEGKPVDYRTDVYSLGLMLFEVFTGTQAFRADNAVAVALKQMHESPPLPRQIEPMISASLETVILRCLEKDPAKRFQSMAELEDELRLPEREVSASSTRATPAAHSLPSAMHMGVSPTQAVSQTKRISPAVWALAGFLIVLAGAAGGFWLTIGRSTATIPPTPLSSPPAPATKDSVSPAPSEKPKEAVSASAITVKPRTPAAKPPAATVTPILTAAADEPTKNVSDQTVSSPPVPESPQQPGNPPSEAAPSPNAKARYLLVGRFQREDRAQEVAKKIEDLGLPVAVFPKRSPNGSNFFSVLAGPFGPKKEPDALLQLQNAGFANVHPVRMLLPSQARIHDRIRNSQRPGARPRGE